MPDPRRAALYATLAETYAALARLEAEDAGVVVAAPVTLSSTDSGPAAVYATAEHNPLGSAKAFLNAHRSGAFPTFKRGRTIAARWSDVEAWMVNPARRVKAQPANDLDADLRQAARAPRRRAGGAGGR